ncbi:MAG TPA: PQQ-binding-like beta-propeller repeat protein, partial [Ktedonobacterales bacterium]
MFGNGKVFVSHTHEDNAACAPVVAALDAWQVDYWFDTAQLSPGLELFGNIQRGLQERDIFVRICSPAANASPWMAEEQKLARTLRAPNRRQRRMIDLIVKPGYVVSAEEMQAHDRVIDTTRLSQVEWLRQLRETLGVPSRERRVSRRAVLGIGLTSLAALGGTGFAGKLMFFTPPSPNLYLPKGYQPTPTALPGASRIRWTFSLYPQPYGALATSVVLAGKTLVCNAEGSITAVSADGKFLWIQRQFNVNHYAPPAVAGDAIYATYLDVAPAPGDPKSFLDNTYLAAFNLSDGSERWHQLVISDPDDSLSNGHSTSAVTVANNAAYLRYNQTLYACDATTGKTLWSQSAGSPSTEAGEILPAPTVAGDTVFAVLGDHNLHAFSALNGAPRWPAPFAGEGPIRTRPIVADGVVYVGADRGWCYALDATTGAIRWKTPLLNTTDKQLISSFISRGLTLSDNVLYICGGFPLEDYNPDGSLHGAAIQALDPATGKILWSSS